MAICRSCWGGGVPVGSVQLPGDGLRTKTDFVGLLLQPPRRQGQKGFLEGINACNYEGLLAPF